MERDERMGRQLYERMHNVPTKQNHDPSKEDTTISNHHRTRELPFKQIVMDLITGLPKHNRKDAILTIVDHGCS
jgi:hypothetical protein